MKFLQMTTIQEMNEEKEKLFVELIYKNYAHEVEKFLQTNKDYIKNNLTKSARKIFEDEVLKQKTLKPEFLRKILETLNPKLFENFMNRILKTAFKQDKELVNSITVNKEFKKEELINYLAKLPGEENDTIISIFDCLGIDTGITKDQLKNAQQSRLQEDMKKTVEERDILINSLKTQIHNYKETHNKELKEAFAKAAKTKKELDEKDEEIKELKKTVKELQKKEQKVQNVEIDQKAEDNLEVEETVNKKIGMVNETEPTIIEKGLTIDFNNALDDLESRTLIGVVKAEGVKPDKGWVIVTPVIPIISENSNIDREEFCRNVDYRSDYSSFLLFLNKDVLRMVLSDVDFEDYPYMTNDQKFSCLFGAFCGKLIFFRPQFVQKDGEKYKLDAYLLSKPIEYKDFNNSTFVPSFNGTRKEFESKIAKHSNLVMENYPYSLSSNLKYIFVNDSIYEINYIPDGLSTDGRAICWKYSEQSTKEPFRKLELNISSEPSDKYVLVPSPYSSEPDNLYVKNIMFIQPSTKSEAIFDEEEFINNVSKNAKSRNLYYKENDLRNFHVAVKSSNLVILAGPSGIGKTRLPMVYANTLGLDVARNTVLFVPISPSYLEPEDVLGYIRPMSEEGNEFNAEYMESQTGLVSFLIDAAEHKDKIHLVIFDEMNLSQIEHWFAPFISVLEQDPDSRELKLYSDNLIVKNRDKYPGSINIGDNVFFVGTVNIDETTKQISDRLLDRAVIINLAAPSFTSLKNMGSAKTEIYPEITFSRFTTAVKKVGNSATEFNDREFALINDLNALLTDSIYNKSISFRSLNKMALYLKNSSNILSRNEAIDFVILQIVVKKINGSKEELEKILSDDDTQGILKVLNDFSDVSEFVNAKKVIQQKILEINKYGFTR